MNKPRILFWHRKDLRIFDNQALIKAFSLSDAITSTYIFDKNYSHDFNASSRAWFLGNSLQELGNNWKKMGSRLVLEEGDPVLIIPQLAKKIDAKCKCVCMGVRPMGKCMKWHGKASGCIGSYESRPCFNLRQNRLSF